MSIFVFKIIIIFFIIAVALLGAYGAFKLKETQRSKFYFSIGNTFAAGIFLGAGLIHMLPDATEEFSQVIHSDFPFAPFIATLGFLLILSIEKIMSNSKKQTSYVLIFILSVHSIIVGIALGNEKTMSLSIVIAIAVLAHKGSAAFALTISMIKSKIETEKIKKFILLFSIMTPLGVLIGIIFSHIFKGNASDFSIAMFDALASGTFLYVAIMDIFNDEFKGNKDIYLKLLSSTLGLLLMALLAVWL